jgi:two-component system LytT family sensor kinase
MVEQHTVALLVKIAVAASIASIMVRFAAFQRMLMREERTLNQRLKLALGFSAVFAASVGTRLLTRTYRAVDLGLEGSLLAGVVGGYVTGLVSGILISLPAMFNGEYLSMLIFAGAGVLGGLLRDLAPEQEEVWRFTPLLDLRLFRLFRKWADRKRTAFHSLFLASIIFAEFLRFSVARIFGTNAIFSLHPTLYPDWASPHPLSIIGVYVTTVFSVTIPLKIWNNARTEQKLESHQRLLSEARLEALTSQINPHFLFNTLNSVSSLIRINPEQARVVVYKLSTILRRLLQKHESFSPLREELSFIDDYMSIEMVRFGDSLRFLKEVEPDTLDRLVPSMLLQPLVENSLRHGLANKVSGGMIRIRGRMEDGWLHLLVEDDGIGIPESAMAKLFEQGIGISNVNERLKVVFGNDYRMWIDSKPGEGTRTQIEIPDLQPNMAAAE